MVPEIRNSASTIIYVLTVRIKSRDRGDVTANGWKKGKRRLLLGVLVVAHHLLKLLEAHIAVPVGIHGLDHAGAILLGAALPEAREDLVELRCRDPTVVVLIVQLEGLPELLLRRAVRIGVAAAEGGELLEVDVAVLVGVDLLHHAGDLFGGGGGEDSAELVGGDLAVVVGIEALEDLADLDHVLEVEGRLGIWGRDEGAQGIDCKCSSMLVIHQTKQHQILPFPPTQHNTYDLWTKKKVHHITPHHITSAVDAALLDIGPRDPSRERVDPYPKQGEDGGKQDGPDDDNSGRSVLAAHQPLKERIEMNNDPKRKEELPKEWAPRLVPTIDGVRYSRHHPHDVNNEKSGRWDE
ncbi:ssDNA-binding transcriptional regulator [Striga asiatica]|uniref:SsDNA-binding transcriptional regulator n=1 Tax=Striga asiatica TaxID=4170 RepID=A0A5A7QTF1_STRAF|nr:ssDNA-binding transcriptional regulator [Striga asiatica]